MKQQIGFKNFRKFENFPPIDLGGINIFVGKNGSGKSTAIKAILVLLETWAKRNHEYDDHKALMAPPISMVTFASDKSSHLYLGNFETSLCNQANEKEMTFCFQINDTKVEIVCCDKAQNLKTLIIENEKEKIKYSYEFDDSIEGGNVICEFSVTKEEAEEDLNYLLCTMSETLMSKEETEEILNKYFDNMSKSIQGIESCFTLDSPGVLTNSIEMREKVVNVLVDNSPYLFKSRLEKHDINKSFACAHKDVENEQLLRFFRKSISNKNKSITNDLRRFYTNYDFIEAHNVSHKVLLDVEDKNNYVAQVVNRYYDIFKNEPNEFVNKWLKEFEIGESFSIEDVDGEAYKVYIRKGKHRTLLAHEGTGSIQMFTLLLSLSVIMRNNRECIIFIEEPEQNLHPSLQSKLAELFYVVHNKTERRIRFIVETHSEYLVRKLQLIAAEEMQKQTPLDVINDAMKVYYFPENNTPYDMEFMSNGLFKHGFGSGFFDEAGKSFRELLKIERGL